MRACLLLMLCAALSAQEFDDPAAQGAFDAALADLAAGRFEAAEDRLAPLDGAEAPEQIAWLRLYCLAELGRADAYAQRLAALLETGASDFSNTHLLQLLDIRSSLGLTMFADGEPALSAAEEERFWALVDALGDRERAAEAVDELAAFGRSGMAGLFDALQQDLPLSALRGVFQAARKAVAEETLQGRLTGSGDVEVRSCQYSLSFSTGGAQTARGGIVLVGAEYPYGRERDCHKLSFTEKLAGRRRVTEVWFRPGIPANGVLRLRISDEYSVAGAPWSLVRDYRVGQIVVALTHAVRFDETPLRDALRLLAAQLERPLVLDPRIEGTIDDFLTSTSTEDLFRQLLRRFDLQCPDGDTLRVRWSAAREEELAARQQAAIERFLALLDQIEGALAAGEGARAEKLFAELEGLLVLLPREDTRRPALRERYAPLAARVRAARNAAWADAVRAQLEQLEAHARASEPDRLLEWAAALSSRLGDIAAHAPELAAGLQEEARALLALADAVRTAAAFEPDVQAVTVSGGAATALVDGAIVRVGDSLPGTSVQVTAIEGWSVELTSGRVTLRVPMEGRRTIVILPE